MVIKTFFLDARFFKSIEQKKKKTLKRFQQTRVHVPDTLGSSGVIHCKGKIIAIFFIFNLYYFKQTSYITVQFVI